MMRDSPPELARLFAAPCASISRTEWPARRSSYAIQEPKTPAPITAQSKVSAKRNASLRLNRSLIHQVCRSYIFDSQSERLEDQYLFGRDASTTGVGDHLA